MLFGFIGLLCILLLIFIKRKPKTQTKQALVKRNGHTSAIHQFVPFDKRGFYYCNVCKKLLATLCGPSAQECSICGILVHWRCGKRNTPDCKYVSSSEVNHYHQWVAGNLPMSSVCCHCGLICAYFYDLEGLSCLWCQRVVHDECREHLSEQCDLGDLNNIIVSPTIDQLAPSPIIVVINTKSGGQSGAGYFKSFNRYLNPIQVISLTVEGCSRLLMFKGKMSAKIIVAGGDGTVGSVINYLKDNDVEIPVAILPLGTGNDLSRALGWGGSYESIDALNVLQLVNANENATLLDRWSLVIQQKRQLNRYVMFNYFGIGLDAKFCYDFHNLRNAQPGLFKSRIGNKFIYGHMGFRDYLLGTKSGLGKNIKLYCDGKQVSVPGEVENLIVLNINYWSGGVTGLWVGEGQFKQQRINDGLLEIIGIKSTLHLGRIQVGLDEPYRIAQGREIRIVYSKSTHVQVDGEPFRVGAVDISIKLIDKVQMLTNVDSVLPNWEAKFLRTMDWANGSGLISKEAKNEIVYRMLH